MNEHRILIIDPDKNHRETLCLNLTNEGYSVDIACNAEEALSLKLSNYNLILSELTLAETSGFKLLNQIHHTPGTENLPVIFVSSKASENELLTAFTMGAEDFVSKPYFFSELVARINVIIRRSEIRKPIPENTCISYNQLTLNISNKHVNIDGKEVSFTKKEFEILKLLLENKNYLFNREELLKQVWPEESFVLSRTIDVNINRIRHKIGNYGKHIITRIGLGYCFEG
jgi:two-component system, OmpR family, alkaline phosphatase synthesis response regulator PhoP